MIVYLWAIQYRFMRWLRCHTHRPYTIDEYLAAFPGQRRELKALLDKMTKTFTPYRVEPELRIDPECGGVDLQVTAFVPASMPYRDVEQRMDRVWDWQFNQPQHNIWGGYEWTEPE